MNQRYMKIRSSSSSANSYRHRSLLRQVIVGVSSIFLATLLGIGSVAAQNSSDPAATNAVPEFFQNSLPEHAIGEMLKSYSAFKKGSALDTRTRELIALSVAAQIPCSYCIYAHRRNALKAGASDAELRDAVAVGAFVRFWSSAFQGAEIDFEAFKKEHTALLEKGS